MIVSKSISLFNLIKWTGHHIVWLTIFMGSIVALYHYGIIEVSIPWLPVSVVGTAVAFYVGFKNNQAYDRMWEARKIWGGIINDSRTWGMMIDGYVSNLFNSNSKGAEEIHSIKKRLIYRHIAWLYAHRSQLLIATPWEHVSQGGLIGGMVAKTARMYQKQFGVGLIDDEVTKASLNNFLPTDEYERLIQHKNTATQIINEQSRDLQQLRNEDVIDDFRHMELVTLLRSFDRLDLCDDGDCR